MSDQHPTPTPRTPSPIDPSAWLSRMIEAEQEELDVAYICDRIEAMVDARMDEEIRLQMRRRRAIVADVASYLIENDEERSQPANWHTPDVQSKGSYND